MSLEYSISESQLILEGYLIKKSVYLKKPRKRWMVIRDNYLYSYKSQQYQSKPTEIFDLLSFYIAMVTTTGNHELGQFELISLNESRTFIAPSLNDMNKWISAINNIITTVNSEGYITNTCSNVLCLSQKQRNGMNTYSKLIKMGFNNNDICLMAACKFEKNISNAINYIIESLNMEAIILRENWIQKRSRFWGKWRKRWTVLMYEPYCNICYLTTYKKRKSYVEPTEFILLNNKCEIFIMDKDNMTFEVNLNDKQKTRIVFKTDSLKLRDEWVSLLISRKNNWTILRDLSEIDDKEFTPKSHHNNFSIESGEKKSFTKSFTKSINT